MTTNHVLGLDAGASSAKWCIADSTGAPVAAGKSSPITGHVFDQSTQQQTFIALESLARAVAEHQPQAVAAGITGLGTGDASAQFFATAFTELFQLAPNRAAIMNDMDLAFMAHLEPGAGILAYGGTGGIAYHIAQDGGTHRAGGRGFLIDDAGGAFALGQAALRQVTTWMDTEDNPEHHALAYAVFAHVGSRHWSDLRKHVYAGGRASVAAFAPIVANVAESGDESATALVTACGQDLARLALRVHQRLLQGFNAPDTLEVVLAGGVTKALGLRDAALAHLRREGVLGRVGNIDIAQAAAKMALELLA